MKILVVESDAVLLASIIAAMQQEKFRCEAVTNYADAIEKASLYHYDIIIIDPSLDGSDGLSPVNDLASIGAGAGIIIISPNGDVEKKVTALEGGADDYLTIPFQVSELKARVKAIFRRREFGGRREFVLDELKIHPDSRMVKVNNQPLELTNKEYDLLVYLLSNRNRLLTKQAIAEYLRGDGGEQVESYDFIYCHIKNLRKKILEKGGMDRILTFYGMGYKFKAG